MNNTEQERKLIYQRLTQVSKPVVEKEVEQEVEQEFFERIIKKRLSQLTSEEQERRRYILDKRMLNRYAKELEEEEKSKTIVFTIEPVKLEEQLDEIRNRDIHPTIKLTYLNLGRKYIEYGMNSLTEVEVELFNKVFSPM
jgi:hypothetical protein